MRKKFIEVATRLADDDKVTVILGDISVGGFLDGENLKKNVHNVGILEQAMVSFAAGIASAGGYPIVQTIVPFLVERAFEQIKLDICAQGNPVALIGVGGGLEYSKLGYTHHCIWDTAILSQLPNLPIFTPTFSTSEVEGVILKHVSERTPIYVRLTNELLATELSNNSCDPVKLTKISECGSNTAVIFCGAYPGIDQDFQNLRITNDIFCYSYANRLPDNLDLLKLYQKVIVIEFGTLPILARLIKQAGIKVEKSNYLRNFFFTDYGAESAAKVISENWIGE